MKKTFNYLIDIALALNKQYLNVSQGSTPRIVATILDSGSPADLSGHTATFSFSQDQTYGASIDGSIVDNTITIDFLSTQTGVSGNYKYELRLESGSDIAVIGAGTLKVHSTVGAVEDTSNMSSLYVVSALDSIINDAGTLSTEVFSAEHIIATYEPIFTKQSGFNLSLGSTAGTVAEGDHIHDSRYYTETEVNTLLTGYSPTSHNHSGVYEPVITKNGAYQLTYVNAAGDGYTDSATIKSNASGDLLLGAGLYWSDGDSGLYESVDDVLFFKIDGSNMFKLNSAGLAGNTSGSLLLINQAATSTVPSIIPNRSSTNSGLGGAAGAPSLIAGGYEAITVQASVLGSAGPSIFIPNLTTAPSSNPTGGGVLFVESGALKYRGSSGTVTTLGAP